ncbi:MAG: hypothetical protein QGI45_14370 [Myxococcota bacterium]|jgi:tetratricopeptide (TPR) repeat protein|nr:hypothetical protein [Myxococcota bacterium]
MRIVQVAAITTTNVGDYVYRVGEPSIALGRLPDVHIVNMATTHPDLKSFCMSADVLILHLLYETDFIPIIKERQALGLPTIYELSDHITDIQPGVGLGGLFADPHKITSAFYLAQLADAMQVTGQGLYDAFGELNNQTQIFENQIQELKPYQERQGDKITIGWGGSSGHFADLHEIAPQLIDTCNKHPEAHFSFMGDQFVFEQLFAALPADKKSYTAPGSMDAYYAFLETLDIGIAPLRNTPYNNCRSDIKFVEYGSTGVAPLLARRTPYLSHAKDSETALFFDGPEEFSQTLEKLILDNELRPKLGKQAHTYVANERLEPQHAPKRLAFYQTLLGDAQTPASSDVPLDALCDDAQVFIPKNEKSVDLLLQGIRQESQAEVKEARQCYQEAMAEKPNFYQAYYWLGRSHKRLKDVEAINVFKQGIEACNLRLSLWLEMIDSLHIFGQTEAWHSAIDDANADFSDVPELLLRQAIALSDKEPQKAEAILKRALDIQPSFSPAALCMAQLLKGPEKSEKRAAYLHQAIVATPNWVEPQLHLCEELLNAENYVDVVTMANIARRITPDEPQVYTYLAQALAALGEEDGAKQAQLIAVKLSQDL